MIVLLSLAVAFQPKLYRSTEIDQMLRSGKVIQAIREMQEMGEAALPIVWDPPPKYPDRESQFPPMENLVSAIQEAQCEPWIVRKLLTQASAVSLDGKILWQRTVAPYRVSSKFWFGYGASPLLLDDCVVIAIDTDNDDRGLYALAKDSGKQHWKASRPNCTSYSSPILASVGGREQIVISGGSQVVSYDPGSGDQIWSVPATSDTTCGTMVWNDSMVFASGGYPDAGTFGIEVAGDSAKVVWENKVKCYEQSMLIAGDYLYGIGNNGVGYCWRASDGTEMLRQRMKGPHSASPLLIGDRIYASNERGETLVFRATSEGFKKLAINRLGDISFATPVYADGKLILRHGFRESGERNEYLIAIGK